jgi:hypothetical protein
MFHLVGEEVIRHPDDILFSVRCQRTGIFDPSIGHQKSGHLFECRYKAIMVEADEYLKELAAYIHLNPVRACIVTPPEKYKWSSHLAYLGKVAFPWLQTDFILSTFSSCDQRKARASFKNFVDSMIDQAGNKTFHGEKNLDSRLLGDEYFLLNILEGSRRTSLKSPT